jgi:hypothetical protein
MLHTLPISSSLTWSFKLYLEKSTSYEAPRYVVFSTLLSLHLSSVQIFSSTPCSSFNIRDQVSHPYRATGKIIVLFILIFKFLDSWREDRRFWTEWQQALPEFNLLLISYWIKFWLGIVVPKYLNCATFFQRDRLDIHVLMSWFCLHYGDESTTCCHVLVCLYIRVSTGNWIYWTITDPWMQVIITVSLIHTLYSSLEHTLKSSQPAVSSPICW